MTKSEKMYALVEQWRQSGLTQKAFCEQVEIKAATFGYWVRKKKQSEQEQSAAGGFARVDVSREANARLEIIYPNGVMLKADRWDVELIHQLISLY